MVTVSSEGSRITAAATGRRLRRGRTVILALGDLIALALAYSFCYAASEQVGPLPPVSAPAWFLVVATAAVPVWLAIFTGYHLYDNDNLRISVASFDEVRDLFHAMLAGSLVFLILSQGANHLLTGGCTARSRRSSSLAAGLVLIPIVRGSLRSWVFPRVMQPRRTLIVGSGREAQALHRKVAAHPEYGLEVVGLLDGDDGSAEGGAGPMLGSSQRHRVDHRPARDRPRAARVVDREPRGDARPDPNGAPARRPGLDRAALLRDLHRPRDPRRGRGDAGGDAAADAARDAARARSSARSTSPSLDRAVSSSRLLLVIVAVAIRLDSRGPALYRQPRRGRHGSTFRIVKFRTMFVGAEQAAPAPCCT